MQSNEAASVFLQIYRDQAWHSTESVSGWGSELKNTERVIRELPGLLQRHGVTSMLDIPCSDFNWMQHVPLGDVRYIGADIVGELVTANQQRFASPNRSFQHLNLLEDALPDVDLVFCRDCLFHFSHADVFRALRQICTTRARFLLTTTFTYWSYPRNANIATGQWTPINLEMPPYNLPPPRALLVEGSTESIDYGLASGLVPQSDRGLGLWDTRDVRQRTAEWFAKTGNAA